MRGEEEATTSYHHTMGVQFDVDRQCERGKGKEERVTLPQKATVAQKSNTHRWERVERETEAEGILRGRVVITGGVGRVQTEHCCHRCLTQNVG